jgi:hypothetical protein
MLKILEIAVRQAKTRTAILPKMAVTVRGIIGTTVKECWLAARMASWRLAT